MSEAARLAKWCAVEQAWPAGGKTLASVIGVRLEPAQATMTRVRTLWFRVAACPPCSMRSHAAAMHSTALCNSSAGRVQGRRTNESSPPLGDNSGPGEMATGFAAAEATNAVAPRSEERREGTR